MFKLAKASGVRVPDFVEHIPAALDVSEIEAGTLVMITGGELDLWTTGNAVAGILVVEAGAARYAAPGSGVYTSTMKNKDQVTFMPVTTTLLIEADIDTGATGDLEIGVGYGINADGEVDGDVTYVAAEPWAAIPVVGVDVDFRVVNFKYDKDGTATKALGFFTNPGYFVS